MSNEQLQAYLQKHRVKASILSFDEHTITVKDAELQLGVSRKRIIKSMLFIDERGTPILAIVTGDRKVSSEKLRRACGVQKVKFGSPRVVRSLTGYEVGALPPVGHKRRIRTIIDPLVLRHEIVYGGGGSTNALLEIRPNDLKRLTDAETFDISKT